MTAMPPLRRLVCAVTALALSAVFFHAQVAAAVVTRGDDLLRGGDPDAALRAYARALWIDPRAAIAADRLAFYLALRHDRADARRAVDIATRALQSAPQAALFADRAFAELQLGRWRAAERDFAEAGRDARDPRYFHFAARMALHRRDARAARADARGALAVDARFAPARALLGSLR